MVVGNEVTKTQTKPLVEAFLLFPEGGQEGKVAVCTNSLAPGMVLNEIPFGNRKDIAVIGSLIVNRDGAERMIINTLTNPTLEYILLFGEETTSFRPSTNLLLALLDGYEENSNGNIIKGGKGIAHMYPSVSTEILSRFRENIKVIPLFKGEKNIELLERYLQWLSPKIDPKLLAKIKEAHAKKEVYYDTLNSIIALISELPKQKSSALSLDPKEFQHLQPPITELNGEEIKPEVPFNVNAKNGSIVLSLQLGIKNYVMQGNDSFLMAYTLTDFLNKHHLKLEKEHQLWLGAELSRVEIALKNDIPSQPFTTSKEISAKEEIPLAARTTLVPDKKFSYRISIKEDQKSVKSLAHESCMSVFELRSKKLSPMFAKLNEENRFEEYAQEALHRMDVGIEIARAYLALRSGKSFFQDFRNVFSQNTTNYPFFLIEGDSFLNVHQRIITELYTKGVTQQHPDTHKGTMRAGVVLAVYRNAAEALKNLPALYAAGTQSTTEMRESYKKNLLSSDNTGAYTYGSRTRAHFGKDQLERAVQSLKKDPRTPFIIQRFDYVEDMSFIEKEIYDDKGNVVKTKLEATHDPCLCHDIYFTQDGKLHSFHIARAHNIVNAYPENIFGLYDAYDQHIANKIGIELGDMFMLSSRANILLLTEEQKAKKLIAEPSKPLGPIDTFAGPYNLAHTQTARGIAFKELQLEWNEERPTHEALEALENYEGINLIEKVITYFINKGNAHNNPIMGTYNPKTERHKRLIFFQANNRADKVYATAVFSGGYNKDIPLDIGLCNYIATQIGKGIQKKLGKLCLFYVPFNE